MNITLLLFAATLFVLPVTLTGQVLTVAPSTADSRAIPYVRTKANRVGINADTLDQVPLRIQNDSTGSGIHFVDHYRHAVIGGFFGGLGGAAIGAAIGAVADARSDDGMIPASAILGIYGAIGGLVLGLLIGVAWPVR